MACRPAGMSDESDSEDEYSSRNDKPKRRTSDKWSGRNGNSGNVRAKDVPLPEESTLRERRESQFRALSACMSGNLNIIEEYISAGNNVNDFLHTGWTLLLYGASAMLPEVIQLLLDKGAKPNKNKDGYTPLMAVCDSTRGDEEKCLRCVRILIDAKANPNAHNKVMKTPLMLACKSQEAGVVAELLKHVKNIDLTDADGRTAFHYAAVANKPETIKLLLKNNASRNIKDREDLTARDIAITKGFDKIVALLESDETGDIETICEFTRRNIWNDLFPALCGDRSELIDCDIAEILQGMGLETYRPLFKGMDLNTFMMLSEKDLVKLGMDIALHRKRFADDLHKFHTKPWSIQSIGSIKKHQPYTLYDGVALLGNAARQIGIIGSSFQFIKKGLGKSSDKGSVVLSDAERAEYSQELKKTEATLLLLKNDLRRVKKLANRVEKENRSMVPAAYIDGKRRKHHLTIILSVALIIGMYLSKTSYVQRLWNN